METVGNNFVAFCDENKSIKYTCVDCDYRCIKKYNWDRHIATARHKKEFERVCTEIKSGKKAQKVIKCLCEKCNRKFETSSGLWKHKKKCKGAMIADNTDDIINDKKLILMLINQNKELIEIVKNGTNVMKEFKSDKIL
jgi:hypothetical protein